VNTAPPTLDPGAVMPAQILTHLDPDWIDRLSAAELAVLLHSFEVWLRPEQWIPTHRWITCGLDGGRGWGKSLACARYVNARVMAGLERHVALMAPTEARTQAVQVRSLIDYSEPGQAPVLFTRDKESGLRWPNGVEAVFFTPEAPGRSRSENISLTWLTELVDWKPSTREEAFANISTATRVGEARLLWDSTAKGRNEVRAKLAEWHEQDPVQHVVIPGTMFDNPLLSTQYLRKEWQSRTGVRREEECMGASFQQSAGASWKQEYFDRTRVAEAPEFEWFMVCVDPATSTHETSDETGILAGGHAKNGHAYATDDRSGTYGPTEWGDIAVELAHPRRKGAGRIGIERKKIGDNAAFVIKSRAENAGLRTIMISKDEPWPPWDPTCIYVREYNPQESKGTRAEGPAAETDAGRVHLVDPEPSEAPRFADLEKECTTYVPGETKRSPNRLDAFAYLVTELRELREDSPPDHARDVQVAAQMQTALDERLRRGAPATPGVVSGLGGAVRGGGRRLGF
jgi:phage terminase large subunit-like protein